MRLRELLHSLPVPAGEALRRPLRDLPLQPLAPLRGLQPLAPLRGDGDPEISGVSCDSRRTEPGDLFVAIPGERFDGRRFVAEAVARGAVAILGRGPAPAELEVPWVEADRPRRLLGPVAASLHGHPDERLQMVGVTGTNGKSTVIALIAAMLEAAGRPTGVLGTLGFRFGKTSFATAVKRTTPEACDVFAILAQMHAEGAAAAVMEVSSHALALGRVTGARFDAAVFTNLSRDHLDFHGDLEAYFTAKRGLFDQRKPAGRAVVGIGDAFGQRLAAELDSPLTFGPGGDVSVHQATLGLDGTRGVLVTPRGELRFESALIGRYNLENLAAAAAAAEALELPLEAMAAGIAGQCTLPGRLETVAAGQPFPVLIDYAHTPAALEAVLRSLRELSGRKIIAVFGCGGGRDRGKRPLMGRIAGELADLPIATSDNPRDEDPQQILSAVESGLKASGNADYRIIPDRREAIRRSVAVAAAGGEWVVLVAGKGHEGFQIQGDRRIPFSDRRELVAALGGLTQPNRRPPAGKGHEGPPLEQRGLERHCLEKHCG